MADDLSILVGLPVGADVTFVHPTTGQPVNMLVTETDRAASTVTGWITSGQPDGFGRREKVTLTISPDQTGG